MKKPVLIIILVLLISGAQGHLPLAKPAKIPPKRPGHFYRSWTGRISALLIRIFQPRPIRAAKR